MLFQGLRISGDTQVHPSDMTKTQMMRDGKDRTLGTLKVCIAVDGGISSVSVASSTKYPDYDARLVAAARGWRYRAYTVNGRPMPACSAVTFVYTIK
jgi:TonB family protein